MTTFALSIKKQNIKQQEVQNKMHTFPFHKWMEKQSRQENLIYLVLWAMLFVAPLLSMYVHSVSDQNFVFEWSDLWIVWPTFLVFLVLFLIHNFLLAPLLIYQQRRSLYFSIVTVIVVLFSVYQCTTKPRDFRPDFPKQEMRHEGPHHPHKHPPIFIGQHDVIAVFILVLMFGMNVGIKGYFKHRGDQKKMKRLEHQNLEQQLEYLKYQINPHFFMNTLNNIHALVDIDPEKAKSTIVELSKMMRFILYEGDKHGVPLTREFEFIRTYLSLMRLRYTDKVKITVELPTEVPDKTVPPLMLISFIENAFKHGISYQRDSFIDIHVSVEQQRLRFLCHNSKADKPNQEKGGVGLANVRQRLQLLYDNNFTLNIQDNPDTYHVELTIPL